MDSKNKELKEIIKNLRFMVFGHAEHGKDEVCEIIKKDFGLDFISSSNACNEEIIFPKLKDEHNYSSLDECFQDRGNHRSKWHVLISEYNIPDKAKLGRKIFSEKSVYCGIRCIKELDAIRELGLFDIAIWVDASNRVSLEAESSNTVSIDESDFIIDNNGKKGSLRDEVNDVIFNIALYYFSRMEEAKEFVEIVFANIDSQHPNVLNVEIKEKMSKELTKAYLNNQKEIVDYDLFFDKDGFSVCSPWYDKTFPEGKKFNSSSGEFYSLDFKSKSDAYRLNKELWNKKRERIFQKINQSCFSNSVGME